MLYAYNRWANARLLDSASLLSDALLAKDLGTSYQSIFATLRHIAWGEWLWLDRWCERSPTGHDPLHCADLTRLRTSWSAIQREQTEFVASITPTHIERLISYENPAGTRWTYTLRHMLQHVVNHSTYHRGQVAGMLRQVGTTPPATDYLLYVDEVAGSATIGA
ncbi:MAG: DinB family protein [Vicinamibacterales bacterium]